METRGDAEQPKLTCSVDVLSGRASAIQMALAGSDEARVPPATCPGPQGNKTTRMERVS